MSTIHPKWDSNSDLQVLYDVPTLQKRVKELGEQITRDYQGKELVVIGILKGSIVFYTDLIREIDLPITCDFIGTSSYEADKTTGTIKLTCDLHHTIDHKDVLIVEDIIDTGLTMKYLLDYLSLQKPNSIRVCSLLERTCQFPLDYLGFTVSDNAFVVGYGLDFNGLYRNLPYIGKFI